MGIFRKRWESYYTPRRKIPTALSAPDVSSVLVSKVHPSKNISLRDYTFRLVLWQYYSPKRVLPPVIFVPGITNYPSKIHPSRNLRLRDRTFRPLWLEHYQPKRRIYPSQFVPGFTPSVSRVHPSRNLRLRDNTFRQSGQRVLRRKLPTTQTAAGQALTLARHKVFLETRSDWWRYYKRKRSIPPSQFIPGTLPVKHPRLRNNWQRYVDHRYYRKRRALPPSEIFVPGWLAIISRVHPARNLRLRDGTFRPLWDYHQPARVFLNVPEAPTPPVVPDTDTGGRHPGPKGRSWIKRWWLFPDEIERLDEEVLLLDDDF